MRSGLSVMQQSQFSHMKKKKEKKESALLHRRVTFLPSDLSYFLPPFWFLLLSSPLSALVVNGVDQPFWFPLLLMVDLSARFVLDLVLNRIFS